MSLDQLQTKIFSYLEKGLTIDEIIQLFENNGVLIPKSILEAFLHTKAKGTYRKITFDGQDYLIPEHKSHFLVVFTHTMKKEEIKILADLNNFLDIIKSKKRTWQYKECRPLYEQYMVTNLKNYGNALISAEATPLGFPEELLIEELNYWDIDIEIKNDGGRHIAYLTKIY